jgi:hypothetical protein
MNKHQIAAIATALQRGAATAGRRLQVGGVGLAVAVLAAGCGSSTSTTTDRSATQSQAPTSPAGAHSGWTGIGAPVSAFESAHPPVTGQAGYGSGPTYPGPGQCCEFTELSTGRAAGQSRRWVHAGARNRHVGRGREAGGSRADAE